MKKTLLFITLISFFTIQSQNWGEQILNQPNTGTSYGFGMSVAIDGNFAVIGAPGEGDYTGSAHIYKKDENGVWHHHQKIEDFGRKFVDNFFGFVVAIQGDLIFITCHKDRIDEERFEKIAGSVLVYKKDENDVWNGLQKIRSTDIRTGDSFAVDMAVSGDYLVAGSPYNDYDASNNNLLNAAGAAYIFKKDNNGVWNQMQKITPTQRIAFDYFGRNVNIYGDYILISGTKNTNDADEIINDGNASVYLFKKDNNEVWTQVQKIKPNNSIASSRFGYEDLAIFEDYIAVGATSTRILENNIWFYGAVYIFKKDNDGIWTESQMIKEPEASGFGYGISLDNNLLLISAPKSKVIVNGIRTNDVGKSYLYVRNANNQYELAETLQASQVIENSKIGLGTVNQTEGYAAIAIKDNQFILGASNTKRTVGNTDYFFAGTAYISGNVDDLGLLNNVLNIDDTLLNPEIKVFPNPVNDKLNIYLSENYKKINIAIYNVLGGILLEKEINNTSDLRIGFPFTRGVYFVKITSKNNKTKTIKLIKN